MRRPSRTRGSRYGQLLIDSMPPATAMSMSPVAMPCAAEHDGLEARAADLVDGERGDTVGEAAAQRRLPRGILAEPRGHDVAHDAFVDDRRVDAGAAHRLGDDERAELGRGEILQRAEELPGRGANGAGDDGFTHASGTSIRRRIRSRSASRRGALQAREDHARGARDLARPLRALGLDEQQCPLEPDRRGALPIAGPTATFHANSTLPGESGAPRSSSASAPGTAAEWLHRVNLGQPAWPGRA